VERRAATSVCPSAGEAQRQGGDGQPEEEAASQEEPRREVAHPDVGVHRADEKQDEADRGSRPDQWHADESKEYADRAGCLEGADGKDEPRFRHAGGGKRWTDSPHDRLEAGYSAAAREEVGGDSRPSVTPQATNGRGLGHHPEMPPLVKSARVYHVITGIQNAAIMMQLADVVNQVGHQPFWQNGVSIQWADWLMASTCRPRRAISGARGEQDFVGDCGQVDGLAMPEAALAAGRGEQRLDQAAPARGAGLDKKSPLMQTFVSPHLET
jgi:hypothetical protein